ncbi:tripartite tricarboxylate transporter TctB family protein [Halomonas cupida]|uniref:tripartite tricarboxylate transporter TctB family protein n=1 Tax=Halomonas cupida TaxID=44933 RepID=UPI003EF654D8
MTIITKDRVLAASILILCGVLYAESSNIRPPTSWQPYGSAVFPRILLVTIAVLALLILVRSIITAPTGHRPLGWATTGAWLKSNYKVLFLFLFFGIYAAILPYIGYLISTTAFLICSIALLLGIDSRRKVMMNFLISVPMALSIYAIFQLGLGIWLP